MSYDAKCEELAKYFLADEEHEPEEVKSLAQEIQDSIENWFVPRQSKPAECKCYKTNDYDFYPAVITGVASEWTVTEDCPIHRRAIPPRGRGDRIITVEQVEKIHEIIENCSTDVVDYERATDDINAALWPNAILPVSKII